MNAETTRKAVLAALSLTVSCAAPLFLFASIYPSLPAGGANDAGVLGAAVATYWIGAAVTSLAARAVIDLLGSRWIAVLASIVLACGAMFIALSQEPVEAAFVALAAAGAANGLVHPAVNQMIAGVPGSTAVVLGIKQASVPIAAALAGLAIPLLDGADAWRWAFGALAAVNAVLASLVWGIGERGAAPAGVGPGAAGFSRRLLPLGCATLLGSVAASGASAHVVTFLVVDGVDHGAAGLVLSGATLVAAASRVVAGFFARSWSDDRVAVLAAVMLVVAAGGFVAAGALGGVPAIVGIVCGLGVGWGWTGLTHFLVVRGAGKHAAGATGRIQFGSYVGCVVGPVLFVAVAELAWVALGVCSAVAALLLVVTFRHAAK